MAYCVVVALILAFLIFKVNGNDIEFPTKENFQPNDVTQRPNTIKYDHVTKATHVHFSNESVASELQHTICSVKTEEFVAKAESTASRILHGVCTTEEMVKVLKNVEKSFVERLEKLQKNLTDFIQSKFQPLSPQRRDYVRAPKMNPFKTVSYFSNFT